jgi:hypothetical protein
VPAQRDSVDLEGRVGSTHPSEFMPARLAAGRQEPLEAPRLFDPLDLSRGRWLLVLEDATSLLTSAVVADGLLAGSEPRAFVPEELLQLLDLAP